MGALINATGTLSYKGAAYLGGLVWMTHSVGGVLGGLLGMGGDPNTRPKDAAEVLVTVLSGLFDTVGLSLVLNYWGTRTNPLTDF